MEQVRHNQNTSRSNVTVSSSGASRSSPAGQDGLSRPEPRGLFDAGSERLVRSVLEQDDDSVSVALVEDLGRGEDALLDPTQLRRSILTVMARSPLLTR
jgi:hypothetical protein